MAHLKEHEFAASLCAECRRKEPVGPCASCEGMICGDCGVLTTDPVGTKCICLSCARLIASVGGKSPVARPTGRVLIAWLVLVVFAVAVIALSR